MSKGSEGVGGGWFWGVVAILGTLVAWSVAPLLIRSFRDVVDPHTSNAVRYATAAVIWGPVLWLAVRGGRVDGKLLKRAAVPVFWNAVAQVCFTMSFYEIDPGLVTFALRAQIATVAIVAPFLFPRERKLLGSWRFLAGLAMVLTGVLAMAWLGLSASRAGVLTEVGFWQMARGFGLAMMAGVGYAGYALGVRKCLDGVPHTISFAVIGWTTALVMVVVMVVASPTRGMEVFEVSLGEYGRLLLTGVIGIAASHVLYYFAMERLGVALASGMIQTQPVFVATASALVYGERLLLGQWGFGGLAIAGAVTMVWAQHTIHRRERAVAELAAGEGNVALYEAERGGGEAAAMDVAEEDGGEGATGGGVGDTSVDPTRVGKAN